MYIVSKNKIVHDLDHLSERCNTDQVSKSQRNQFHSDEVIQMVVKGVCRFCKHCLPGGILGVR